jgi:putative endonuclease
MYYVYILKCKDGSLYTGITNDLGKRLAAHKAGKASAYTRSRKPESFIHIERKRTKGNALKREAAIKRLSRTQKLALIQ